MFKLIPILIEFLKDFFVVVNKAIFPQNYKKNNPHETKKPKTEHTEE